MSIGVVVIEKDFLVRWGLIAALQQEPRLEVYGSGFDPRSALFGLERLPAVVLLGSQRGVDNRSRLEEVLHEVRVYFPQGPIVAISPEDVNSLGTVSMRDLPEGPVVLLNPGSHPLDICRTVLHAAILAQSPDSRMVGTPNVGLERLTPREWDVVRLLGRRWESQEIAEALSISYSTVRSHLRSIYAKLGVTNRREAVREAVRILRYWDKDGLGSTAPANRSE